MIENVRILGFNKKSFEKDGKTIEFARLLVRTDDGVVVNLKTQKDYDWTDYVDQDVNIDISLESDLQQNPKLRALKVAD